MVQGVLRFVLAGMREMKEGSGASRVLPCEDEGENHAEVFVSDYSYRSATMGSTFAARRAGT
jgi:hypothetical protein